MTEESNINAIKSDLAKFKRSTKINHLYLIIKELYNVQSSDTNITLFNTSNSDCINQINIMGSNLNTVGDGISDTNICYLFNNDYKLFKFISKLLSTTKFIKKINKSMANDKHSLEKLLKVFNFIILVRTISSTISRKNMKQINNFNLLNEINSINPKSENIFMLHLLKNSDIANFLNSINYSTFSMNELSDLEKKRIHEVFNLFRIVNSDTSLEMYY